MLKDDRLAQHVPTLHPSKLPKFLELIMKFLGLIRFPGILLPVRWWQTEKTLKSSKYHQFTFYDRYKRFISFARTHWAILKSNYYLTWLYIIKYLPSSSNIKPFLNWTKFETLLINLEKIQLPCSLKNCKKNWKMIQDFVGICYRDFPYMKKKTILNIYTANFEKLAHSENYSPIIFFP